MNSGPRGTTSGDQIRTLGECSRGAVFQGNKSEKGQEMAPCSEGRIGLRKLGNILY